MISLAVDDDRLEIEQPPIELEYDYDGGYRLEFDSDYTAESPYWFACSIGFYLMRTVKKFKCKNARLLPVSKHMDGMRYEAGFPVSFANECGGEFKEDEKEAALKWIQDIYLIRKTYIYYLEDREDAMITLKPEHGAARHGYLFQRRDRHLDIADAQNFLDHINVYNNYEIYTAYLLDPNGEEIGKCYGVPRWDLNRVASWIETDVKAGREPSLPESY